MNVVVVESNRSGNGMDAIERLLADGCAAHYVTSRPNRFSGTPQDPAKIATMCHVADTCRAAHLLAAVRAIEPDGIVTFTDEHTIPAAIVARTLGLVAPDVTALENSIHKARTRQCTSGLGYDVGYAVLDTASVPTRSPVGLPCVVKPLDGSGSLGVRVCTTHEDFREAVRFVRALPGSFAHQRRGSVQVEEFVEGPEYSAEAIWCPRERAWDVVGFTAKIVGPLPHRIELGHLYPHSFGRRSDEAIRRTVVGWLRAVGLSHAAAHVEFKLVDGEAALIEINPRLAGDCIPRLVRWASGVDLVRDCLTLSLGSLESTRRVRPRRDAAAIAFLASPREGRLMGVRFPDGNDASIVELCTRRAPADVRPPQCGGDRLGYVIGVAETTREAIQRVTSFTSAIRLEFQEGGGARPVEAEPRG